MKSPGNQHGKTGFFKRSILVQKIFHHDLVAFLGKPVKIFSFPVKISDFRRKLLVQAAFLKARLKSDVRTRTGLKRFLPATLSGEFEDAGVELASWQGSGDIAALAKANCYLVVPPDRERIEAGEWVSVMMR